MLVPSCGTKLRRSTQKGDVNPRLETCDVYAAGNSRKKTNSPPTLVCFEFGRFFRFVQDSLKILSLKMHLAKKKGTSIRA